MGTDRHSEVVGRLRESRKYRDLCGDTLYRMAGWALERNKDPKQAVKLAKRKLHQVYGAYVEQMDGSTIEALVDALPRDSEGGALRNVCREILQCHSSTRERLPEMDRLFSDLFQRTGRPSTIADIACGLNPFAWPWMHLRSDARYHAMDIDRRLVANVNRFFSRVGIAECATCHDILVSTPAVESDVVFLFKTLPVVEQQEKGRSLRLLEELRTDHVVASFPVESLGGRKKGMRRTYGDFMDALLDRLDVSAEMMALSNEVFYVIDMRR